jgi:protein tyrosine phosphatase type 4A
MRKHSVTDLVRVCEPTYQGAELQTAGIVMHDMEYPDGHSPPQPVIDQWLQLVDKVFFSESSATEDKCISVHCVAGLGRAPVMVAIAMIEFANYDPVEAVSMIRRHRRGAINEKQLLYLEGYKRTYKKKKGSAEAGCCIIS